CDDWRRALRAATAAEVYHAASDTFDDLEDGDTSPLIERHGAPIALNVATALLALMHKALEPATAEESVACRRAQDALWEGIAVARAGDGTAALNDAVWQGGIQLAYALMHAERARAQEALEVAAVACPDPAFTRTALAPLLVPRGAEPVRSTS